MFGYVVPNRSVFTPEQKRDYQSAYCGLCHSLGRRYGFFARFILNYDFTFLAMLLEEPQHIPEITNRRCIACPHKGKPVCGQTVAMDKAADASVILTYWKLKDNASDDGFWKRLMAKLLCFFFKPAYQKAAKAQPQFDHITQTCLGELAVLEGDKIPSLDRPADTFARILSGAVVAEERPALAQLLYHVGRWIYLVDAWDDRLEDEAEGRYNPILLRYAGDHEAQQPALRTTLGHSLNLAISAYHLEEPGYWNDLILNILCMGLPGVEQAVFDGTWRQRKKENGRTHHE